MPSQLNQYTPVDTFRCGYFGVEHQVKEKRPRGRYRTAKLVLCASQTEAQRILTEYRNTVLSLPNHQNIMTVKDAFLHKQMDLIYLCTIVKFCASETLNSFLISRHDSLNEEAKKALFLQLADAVSYLHAHGISHNALTPYSIRIMESKGNALVKLTDHGLAQICSQPDDDNLDISRSRSLVYYLPPEAYEAEWCNMFARPNTSADVFMLGLLFNSIAEHSILQHCPDHEKESSDGKVLASYLQFPGYGAVPIGKFLHENPSVDIDHQLYRLLSPHLRRLVRRMVFLEPDGRPPMTGVIQMLESIDTLLRPIRRSSPDPEPLTWPLDSGDETDSEIFADDNIHPTNPKRQRKPAKVPYNPSISPIQKRFVSTVITDAPERSLQKASGLVRRASRRMKKTSDRFRKRGSAKISG